MLCLDKYTAMHSFAKIAPFQMREREQYINGRWIVKKAFVSKFHQSQGRYHTFILYMLERVKHVETATNYIEKNFFSPSQFEGERMKKQICVYAINANFPPLIV